MGLNVLQKFGIQICINTNTGHKLHKNPKNGFIFKLLIINYYELTETLQNTDWLMCIVKPSFKDR